MNHLFWAALLCAVVAVGHSVIGEWMIFRRLRRGTIVPLLAIEGLREYQVRIIWASWHVVTFLGLAIAALLWQLAQPGAQSTSALPSAATLLLPFALAFTASGFLVGFATRMRHPAWVALLCIAGLLFAA